MKVAKGQDVTQQSSTDGKLIGPIMIIMSGATADIPGQSTDQVTPPKVLGPSCLRSVKAAPNVLCVTRKYVKVLQ